MASINPAFKRHPDEAALVGRIVVHFGELEVSFCQNTSIALDANIPLMKALYSLKATSSRIDFMDGLIRNLYLGFELGKEYDISIAMLRYCLRIRNLFAHCNWADDHVYGNPGLYYADLQDSAKTDFFTQDWKHVDIPLLQKQEDYFAETQEWLSFLRQEVAVKKQMLLGHDWPRPSELEQPPLHNLASQHIPPWLTLDQRVLHLERALAAESPPRQPLREPSVLRLTREEWALKDAKDARERAAREAEQNPQGHSDPIPEQ
jgi:hypothetical protein